MTSSHSTPKSLLEAIRSNLLGSAAASFADVTLISSDHQRVPAVRALLGVRSAYFRSRFFAGYSDRSLSEIHVPHTAQILREVLSFAYTDDSRLLQKVEDTLKWQKNRKRKPGEAFAEHIKPKNLVNLVELVVAADYFQMNTLSARAANALADLVSVEPKFACLVFEAARRQPAVTLLTDVVIDRVKSVMRRAPHECLLVEDFRRACKRSKDERRLTYVDSGVLMLGEDSLREVLRDDDLFTSETYLFQVLYFWGKDGDYLPDLRNRVDGADHPTATADPPQNAVTREFTKQTSQPTQKSTQTQPGVQPSLPNTNPGIAAESQQQVPSPQSSTPATQENDTRWKQAKRLVRYINMERLKPSFLRDYVESSGLLDREGILNVYRQQALEAERGRALYDSFRGGSVWSNGSKTLKEESTGGYRSRMLTTPWMKAGRHEWTFRIDKESDCTWLGVVGIVPTETQFFGSLPNGWAYATSGTCTQQGMMQRRKGPVVREGKTVKLILNLTRKGTVTMITEEARQSFRAFADLKLSAKQFKPVVYLKRPACVTLVGEKHTME